MFCNIDFLEFSFCCSMDVCLYQLTGSLLRILSSSALALSLGLCCSVLYCQLNHCSLVLGPVSSFSLLSAEKYQKIK